MRVLLNLRILLLALWVLGNSSVAGEVRVAVASNFMPVMHQLAPLFEQMTGHALKASFGSTGKLHAQVVHGAPFDVFLSADNVRGRRLIDEGLAVDGSQFIYAQGRLALWSRQPDLHVEGPDVLANPAVRRLAIANPKTAPYGAAAVETMKALNRFAQMESKLVRGENIAQAQQFVHSGNAQLGFVAYAQVLALKPSERGSHWLVPSELHQPIAQEALMLRRGEQNEAAKAFLAFLKSPQATALIREMGYSAGH